MSELPKISKRQPPVPKTSLGPSPAPPPLVVAAPRSPGSVWLLRAGMLLACLASGGLLYWSVTARLQPASKQFQERTTQMASLADEVENLRRKWEQHDFERTRARYEAAQEFLVRSPEDLLNWEQELKTQSAFTSLETICQWARPEPHPEAENKLGLITGQLVIRPAFVPGMTNSPYKRLLNFTQGIATMPRRFDLVRLTVDGNSNSVKSAVAVVQLLSTEREATEP